MTMKLHHYPTNRQRDGITAVLLYSIRSSHVVATSRGQPAQEIPPQDVYEKSVAFFCDRLANCAHAIPLLVEHMVWATAVR